MKKEALRVSTTIPAAPTTLYLAWLSSEQHSAMTGSPAKIENAVGGNFSALNGQITGKLVILDLGRRLVMSWRAADFPRDAPDSRVEVHLEALGGNTRLTVLHTEIPEGLAESYRVTWNDKYFGPMRTFFSKYLPDPRQPPAPRRLPATAIDEADERAAPKKASLAEKSKTNKATASPHPASNTSSNKKTVTKPDAKKTVAKPEVAKPDAKKTVAKPEVAKPDAKKTVAKPDAKPDAKKTVAKPATPVKTVSATKKVGKKSTTKPSKPAKGATTKPAKRKK